MFYRRSAITLLSTICYLSLSSQSFATPSFTNPIMTSDPDSRAVAYGSQINTCTARYEAPKKINPNNPTGYRVDYHLTLSGVEQMNAWDRFAVQEKAYAGGTPFTFEQDGVIKNNAPLNEDQIKDAVLNQLVYFANKNGLIPINLNNPQNTLRLIQATDLKPICDIKLQ